MDKKFVFNRFTPFFLGQQKVGISAPNCIYIDVDIFKEALLEGHQTVLTFNIDFRSLTYDINETRTITVLEVMNLLNADKAKLFKSVKSKMKVICLNRLDCKFVSKFNKWDSKKKEMSS